jgi:O-antigen ligase
MKDLDIKNSKHFYNKLFPFLIGFIPFVFPTIVNDPSQTPLYLYLYLISFLLFVFNLKEVEKLRYKKLDLFYLVAFWAGVLSALVNTFDFEAIYELLRFISVILFIATFRFYFSLDIDHFNRIVKSLVFVCVLYLFFGIIDVSNNNISLFDNESSYFLKSHLGHRNLFAIMLALFLPILFIYTFIVDSIFKKSISVFLILIIMFFLLILMSRVGWIGIFLFTITICVYLYKAYSKKWVLFFVHFILIIGILFVFNFKESSPKILKIQDRITSFFDYKTKVNDHTSTINERLILWEKSKQLIQDHLWIGVGPGQWKFQIPKYDLSGTRAEFGHIVFPQPHNDFIWYFSELGVLGGFLVVLFFGNLLYLGFVFVKNTKNIKERNIVLFSLTGVVIFLCTSFFDFPKERPVHNFVLSFFISSITFYISSESLNERVSSILNKALGVLFLIGVLFFAVRFKSEINLFNLLKARSVQDYEIELKYAKLCRKFGLKYDLTTTPISFYEGEALVYQSKISEAIDKFKLAIQENPYHLYSYSNLGSCYFVLGQKATALKTWNDVLEFAPNFSEARVNKAIMYYQENNLPQAEQVLHFKTMESQYLVYKIQILVIFKSIATELAEHENNPLLKQKIYQIIQDDNWIYRLFLNMNLKNTNQKSFRSLIYEDAIYDLEVNEYQIDSKTANIWRSQI